MSLIADPTAEELLVVRAAVSEGPAAVEAWNRYRGIAGGIDRVQGEAFQLLPHVYRSLEAASYDGAELGRLKGLYRRTWYANSVLVHAAGRAGAALAADGVDAMLIGRTALLVTHVSELGARPAYAVDVLVAPADVPRALSALRAGGWSATPEPPGPHPILLVDDAGTRLRLHRSSLGRRRRHEERVWRGAVRVDLDATTALVPSCTDQLVFVCGGGCGWPAGRLRWIADALLLVCADRDRIAWDALVARAHAAGRTRRVAAALTVLGSEFGVGLPAETVDALRTIRAGARERLASLRRGAA